MARKDSKIDRFKELTRNDLMDWAGSKIVSRGQSYQRGRQVEELARTSRGGLVAWVHGTEMYATRVEFENGNLASDCTCPFEGTCKHAVAVVLEYIDGAKKNKPVPVAPTEDERLCLLEAEAEDEWDEDGMDDDDDIEPVRRANPKKAFPASLSGFLERQTKEQLLAVVLDLMARFPEVRQALEIQSDTSKGNSAKLVPAIRNEIRELSSEPGWRNNRDGEGFTPDYSGVRDRLKKLMDGGHADEVVQLGRELLKAGIRQVETSHDEGDTAEEISSCLDIVFRALSRSSLSPFERMLWAVDAELDDQYDLCRGAEFFWNQKHGASHWSLLADKLLERLNRFSSGNNIEAFSRNYRRDGISNWVVQALENAGRKEDIIPLCEKEAEITQSYSRLVKYLREAGRLLEAGEWIKKGILATQAKLPGIAGELRSSWREMREEDGDGLKVAACRAEDFFFDPTLHTFQELQKAAKKAKVWPEVRTGALAYLETGKPPGKETSWPLAETGLPGQVGRRQTSFPDTETLIDVAIEENRPDEVIRWYDHKPRGGRWNWLGPRDDRVAAAVADRYPDRAVAIWKKLAEGQIALTKPSAYEAAAAFLKKAYRLFKEQGKEKEWEDYIHELRRAHKAKRRLMEILNGIEGKRIIDG